MKKSKGSLSSALANLKLGSMGLEGDLKDDSLN